MPNLVSTVDTSDYYFQDIEDIYKFSEISINNENFVLKHATGTLHLREVSFYLLSDKNNNHLSIVRLEKVTIGNKVYDQINKSFSLETGKGYGNFLYTCIFEIHNISIISDKINTLPGSYNLWKRLISSNKHQIFNLDIINKRSKLIKNINNDFLIWGLDDAYLDVIKATPWQIVMEENFEWENDDLDEDDLYNITVFETIERTILADFVIEALRSKRKIKNRQYNVLLIKK